MGCRQQKWHDFSIEIGMIGKLRKKHISKKWLLL